MGQKFPLLGRLFLDKFEAVGIIKNYQNIDAARQCVRFVQSDPELQAVEFDKIYAGIEPFEIRNKNNLHLEQINALLEFPESERRDALIDRAYESFDMGKKMSPNMVSEVVINYLNGRAC